MALIKDFDCGNGVTMTYHRIQELISNFDGMSTMVRIASYVSADIRKQGTEKVVGEPVRYSIDGIPSADPRAWAYTQLVQLPEWTGATEG